MYICKECGHIFEEGEQQTIVERHDEIDGFPEYLSVCPMCGGDYEEAQICEACGGAFAQDDDRFYGKWCKDCLLGMVDYEMFKNYLLDDADKQSYEICDVEWFFFRDLWGMTDAHIRNLGSSPECKADLFSLYDAYVEGDKLDEQFRGQHPFLDKIKNFVADDIYTFAEWLEDHNGKE